jgi:hypothetical protein
MPLNQTYTISSLLNLFILLLIKSKSRVFLTSCTIRHIYLVNFYNIRKNTSVNFSIEKEYTTRCNLPNLFEDMVCCDRCSAWYHYGCVPSNNSNTFSGGLSFTCTAVMEISTGPTEHVR